MARPFGQQFHCFLNIPPRSGRRDLEPGAQQVAQLAATQTGYALELLESGRGDVARAPVMARRLAALGAELFDSGKDAEPSSITLREGG
nr:hypothetical protein [Nocardia amikacinitolerans]